MRPLKAKITPLLQIYCDLFTEKRVKVFVKPEYLNHSEIQGNKYYKLKNNFDYLANHHYNSILTFGGAYSNHIASTAAAAQSANIPSIGIIRGSELRESPESWSHTLKQAQKNGMQLEFVDRQTYKLRNNPSYLSGLQKCYPDSYIIPEGGSNHLGLIGFEELMQQINQESLDWTHLYTAVGTGATLAGLIGFAHSGQSAKTTKPVSPKQIIGIPALKQGEYLTPQIEEWIDYIEDYKSQDLTHHNPAKKTPPKWRLLTQYHHGGYGKQSKELLDFKVYFETHFDIPLDPVYTSKAFYGFFDQLKQDQIKPESTIILLHTGGLQGNT